MPVHIDPTHELVLALDGIQDLDNLGTVIRIADWFGIGNTVCSEDTTDMYDPKVVQAAIGSITHANVTHLNLYDLVNAFSAPTPVYGTLLDGKDVYQQALTATGTIIVRNEGNGTPKGPCARIDHTLLTPNFSALPNRAESLDVAIAVAIACNELERRMITA